MAGLNSAFVASLIGSTAQTAANVVVLSAGVGQAMYGMSQGDYSGIIGLGVSMGMGMYLADGQARGGVGQDANAQAGGLHRAGGENEAFWQKLGDYLDDWTAQKNVVQPGTPEAEALSQSINEISYTPTRQGLQEALRSGNVYTYEQRFGGAEAYSRHGKIFVPTRSLGLPSNYFGSQLAHEYFHVLSYRFTGWGGFEVSANRFGEASSFIGPSGARVLNTYPTAADLYRAALKGQITY